MTGWRLRLRRPFRRASTVGLLGLGTLVGLLVGVSIWTRLSLPPLPDLASVSRQGEHRARLFDRHGEPLAVGYDTRWNLHDRLPLHDMPLLLRQAFVTAEDQRFYDHGGVDWRARAHAMVQNARAGRVVRGASTLTEQVARLLHPRPRSLWARWLEGAEAVRLEARHGKGELLEFYLNQVPYARQRRGVVQAARDYFARDLDTLAPREMLALAVLVRSPSRLDPRRGSSSDRVPLDRAIDRLAKRLYEDGHLTPQGWEDVRDGQLALQAPRLAVEAPHFVQFVRRRLIDAERRNGRLRTTLDGSLQRRLQAVLDARVTELASRGVTDGAVLVVDHQTNEVLAWVNAGGYSADEEGSQIDAILTPRQPGSTLKPFLYALALERGWSAATLIADTPLAGPVGAGLHRFRNYSRIHHGPLRLRTALGNSLNIPAVRTLRTVGPASFHQLLRDLGLESLDRHPEVYGEGLALGNGEVTLYELVGAYAAVARGGRTQPLGVLSNRPPPGGSRRVVDPDIASLIADILSDPDARALEFGVGGILHLPVETAVKTGTSNDYRDAWAMGFSDRHTVGVWLGDLGRREMDGVSGASGPALVLRAAFAELRRDAPGRPLTLSRRLRQVAICRDTGAAAGARCPTIDEWFRPGHHPAESCARHDVEPVTDELRPRGPTSSVPEATARLSRPTDGLLLAEDPRIPDDLEAFVFELESDLLDRADAPVRVEWFVDDRLAGTTSDGRFAWPVATGRHRAHARLIELSSSTSIETPPVSFLVK